MKKKGLAIEDQQGAGNQGIMFGYATSETETEMPGLMSLDKKYKEE